MLHKEIFTKEQLELLPFVKKFSHKGFYMVGGTAIALHIGHRRSIDFDLFRKERFNNMWVASYFQRNKRIKTVIWNQDDQYTVSVNRVKMTFFRFFYDIENNVNFEGFIKIPDLITLAAMKAFALGQRAKWKDFVDLYFIMEYHYSIEEIIKKSKELFGDEFNPKLFRLQLANFDRIDYREEVEYLNDCDTPEETIKKELVRFSLEGARR